MRFYVVAVRDDEQEEVVSGPYETRTEAWQALEQADRPRDGYLAVREWAD